MERDWSKDSSGVLSPSGTWSSPGSCDGTDKLYADGLRPRGFGSGARTPLIDESLLNRCSTPTKEVQFTMLKRAFKSPCRRWSASSPRQQVLFVAATMILLGGLAFTVKSMSRWIASMPPKPYPRNQLDAIFFPGPGSLFGHLYVHMKCPAVHTDQSWHSLFTPRKKSQVPTTLFPISDVLPLGRTSASNSLESKPSFPLEWPREQSIMLLIGILSSCKESQRRQSIRETWMRLKVRNGSRWRAVFLLSKSCASHLSKELAEHRDLLFMDGDETYYAITPKVLQFLEYARQSGAQYTLKTDDDTFVFVDRLLDELQRMSGSCLYWGNGSHLPKREKYNTSGLDVPLNKWYIDPDHYPILADVNYMVGGGYIMSLDVVEKAVETANTLPVPDYLPEDATVGQLIGSDMFSRCSCTDTRHLAHVKQFQRVKLFDPAVLDCERADIMRRVITVHGIKNLTHMEEIMAYATTENHLECEVKNRSYTGKDPRDRLWGREFPTSAWHENFIGKTSKLYKDLRVQPSDPWDNRSKFLSYEMVFQNTTIKDFSASSTILGLQQKESEDLLSSQAEVFRNQSQPEDLVPLKSVLRMGLMDTNRSSFDAYSNSSAKWPGVPWCLQSHWALQMVQILQDLMRHQTLLCDLSMDLFYVHKLTFNLKLHRGNVSRFYDSDNRFQTGPCFQDLQCQACFLQASEGWLPNVRCDNHTAQCPGFDGVAQAKVAFRHVLQSILPANWSEAVWYGTTCQCRSNAQSLMDAIEVFTNASVTSAVDAEAGQLPVISAILEDIVDRPWTKQCISQQHWSDHGTSNVP